MSTAPRSPDRRRTGRIVAGVLARRHLGRPCLMLRQRRHSQETTIAPKHPGETSRVDSCPIGLGPCVACLHRRAGCHCHWEDGAVVGREGKLCPSLQLGWVLLLDSLVESDVQALVKSRTVVETKNVPRSEAWTLQMEARCKCYK